MKNHSLIIKKTYLTREFNWIHVLDKYKPDSLVGATAF